MAISVEDVRKFVTHPDGVERAEAARRLCSTIRKGQLSDKERAFAYKLLDHMSQDALAIVRRALAVTLKNSPELPREIAMKLAKDIDNVAVPILEYSPVLSDDDLIDVLKSKAASKALAVAKRPSVSGTLVRAIVRYGDSQAVAKVAANDGAMIDEETANVILDGFHDDDLIKEAFIARRDLPVVIMEKLAATISTEAAIRLNSRHDIPLELSLELANRTRERATLQLTDMDFNEREMSQFVRRIHREGRLTSSLILRAAGLGRMRMVVHALSVRTGVKLEKVALLVHDTGPFALEALCKHALLNDVETVFLCTASRIYWDLEASGLEYDPTYFQTLMIERILTHPMLEQTEQAAWLLEKLDTLKSVRHSQQA